MLSEKQLQYRTRSAPPQNLTHFEKIVHRGPKLTFPKSFSRGDQPMLFNSLRASLTWLHSWVSPFRMNWGLISASGFADPYCGIPDDPSVPTSRSIWYHLASHRGCKWNRIFPCLPHRYFRPYEMTETHAFRRCGSVHYSDITSLFPVYWPLVIQLQTGYPISWSSSFNGMSLGTTSVGHCQISRRAWGWCLCSIRGVERFLLPRDRRAFVGR